MQEDLSEGRPVSWLAVPVKNLNKCFLRYKRDKEGQLPFLSYY